MPHTPPFRHPNPFKPAQDELDGLRTGATARPRWQTMLLVVGFVLLGLLVVGLHLAGIVGLGLHAAGS